jgi:hypothetical protein
MYKSTPITKKAKTASEYNSALKQVDLVGGNKDMYDKSTKKPASLDVRTTKSVEKGTEETPDEVIKTKKAYVGAENDACSKEYIAKNGNAACEEYKGLSDEVKDAANYDTTVVKGKKGTPDKTTYLDTQIMEDTTRDVLGDPETRELGRTVKKTGKDARRAIMKESRIKNKQAKFDKKYGSEELEPGKKGYRKQQRLKAKATETKGEREAFENAFKAAQSNRESGRKIGSSIAGEDRMRTQGQLTPEEQIAQNKIRQERDNVTETITPKTDFKKFFADAAERLNTFKLNYPTSPASMRAPLKKNYFKK